MKEGNRFRIPDRESSSGLSFDVISAGLERRREPLPLVLSRFRLGLLIDAGLDVAFTGLDLEYAQGIAGSGVKIDWMKIEFRRTRVVQKLGDASVNPRHFRL